jgi:hypothetical protein
LDGFSLDHGLNILVEMAGTICKIPVHEEGRRQPGAYW